MPRTKGDVPLRIPQDMWEKLAEVRIQLDAFCPGPPTPIDEALREVLIHYEGCPRTQEEIETFCERAKAWKMISRSS